MLVLVLLHSVSPLFIPADTMLNLDGKASRGILGMAIKILAAVVQAHPMALVLYPVLA